MRRTRSEARPSIRHGVAPSTLLSDIEALSRNLWWTWNVEAYGLWLRAFLTLEKEGRAPETNNPVYLAGAMDSRMLPVLEANPGFMDTYQEVMGLFRRAMAPVRPPEGLSARNPVAYFSMEFGVHGSLAVYAGGLGILAGDHVKSSGEEGVPLVGVGLFYHNGYFRQELDGKGRQKVIYPKADLERLPLVPARTKKGKELRITVEFPGRVIHLKVWKLHVGRADLLLLDSDIRENRPEDRLITYRLYGGSREDRIRQEVVVGIGGVRALRAVGIDPGVWHLNEGHVAFLTLERLREVREQLKLPVAEALEVVAADTVFTTHTPVPEGNEAFDLALARRYLAPHAEAAGIPLDEYLALGLDRGKDGKPFLSMTVLALRLSRFRNGVSKLHGEVSRRMWSKLWPGFRAEDVPITSVTNGIHTSTWVSPAMWNLLSERVGASWARHLDDAPYWRKVVRIPEKELWEAKQEYKSNMVGTVRWREGQRLARLGRSSGEIEEATRDLLDPEIFTIGFARRFALYKRSALLFHDLERAKRLFASRSRPLQIIFAGKPHPEDAAGKAVFEEIASIAGRKEFRGRVVLLENYDIEVAQLLVQGVDLWLNNPRRPLEASGTSGQKVPVNGGLNLSILDGWWCEGYSPRTGWVFGKPIEYADPGVQDEEDSKDLYRVLEREVLPLYYSRDRSGVPVKWFRKVKTSMADLIPRFSTSHMVHEYARRLYRPALENGRAIRAAGARGAKEIVAWKEEVLRSWPLTHVRRAERGAHATITVEAFLGGIPPGCIACRDNAGNDLPVRVTKSLGAGLHRFAVRGGTPFRLYPTFPRLAHPQELGLAIEVVL